MTQVAKSADPFIFELLGGRLALDFANTVSGTRATPTERLLEYEDLLSWALQVGIIDPPQADQLRARAQYHPKHAATVLRTARALRESIFRIFTAKSHAEAPEAVDLDVLNQNLTRALSRLRLKQQDGNLALTWVDTEDLSWVLWPVAKSAADMLSTAEIDRVHKCGISNCDWLFYDDTRNHSRRFCSMKGCGNRAKARRHYERLKRSRMNRRS